MNNSKIIDISKEIKSILSDKLFDDTSRIEANNIKSIESGKNIEGINEEIDELSKEVTSLYNRSTDLTAFKEKYVLNVSGKYDIMQAARVVDNSVSFPKDVIIAAMETAQECNMKLKFCYCSRKKAILIYDKLKLLRGIKLKITKEIDNTIEDNLKAEMNESYTKAKYILSFRGLKKENIEKAISKLEEYQKNGRNCRFNTSKVFNYLFVYCCSKRECQRYIKEFKLIDPEVKYEIAELEGMENENAWRLHE